MRDTGLQGEPLKVEAEQMIKEANGAGPLTLRVRGNPGVSGGADLPLCPQVVAVMTGESFKLV